MSFVPDQYVGHAAGLGTSLSWTASSLFFAASARRLGPTVLNTVRLAFAVVLLGVTHRLLFGSWAPPLQGDQLYFLAWSGVIGLTLGDQAGFAAFNDVGPRLTALVMTTAPLFAALFGFIALGETLGALSLVGMMMTICGVAWVILERPATANRPEVDRRRLRGIGFAMIAAACQAGGMLFSKQGIGHGWLPREEHLAPQAATLTRVAVGMVASLPVLIAYGRAHGRKQFGDEDAAARRRRRAEGMVFAAGGAVFGPFLGVWMSLVAGDHAPIGVAQTLCSLPPVLLIPCVAVLHKERITGRVVLGAIIAVGGTALLFWK